MEKAEVKDRDLLRDRPALAPLVIEMLLKTLLLHILVLLVDPYVPAWVRTGDLFVHPAT